MNDKNFRQRFSDLQRNLKVPKKQYNSFGKYYYRSCEDILEEAKSLAAENGILITISDDIVEIGNRFYIQATAEAMDIDTGEIISKRALAREPEFKKGMDESQITGMASSYARKYALNGLLCIDDAKDADTDAYRNQQQPRLICADCGKPFSPAKGYTAEQIYEISRKRNPDGVARCGQCMKKYEYGGTNHE